MFMRFPIDALFVGTPDEAGVRSVITVREHLPAWRGIVMPVRGSQGVVELPAGTLSHHGIAADDSVVFEPRDTLLKSEVSAA